VSRPERVLLDPIDELQETLEANLKEVASGPGAQQGLLVTDVVRGGRGEKGRFKSGDIITAVDKKTVKTFAAFDETIRTRFKEIFATDGAAADRRFASSYVVTLEVRKEGQEKVTRDYINLFPDFLAPPVY
jgi:C-terminal processing protease CtpA/Prc